MKETEQSKEEINLKARLKMNFIIFQIFGFWVPSHYRGTAKGLAYGVYSALILTFLVFLPMLSEIIYVVMVFGDLEKVVEGSFLMLTYVVLLVKCVNILRGRTRIQRLVDTLNEPMFNRVDVRSHRHVLSVTRTHHTAKVVYMACCTLTILMWAAYPFLDSYNGIKLPLSAWYPFNVEVSPGYELMFVYQIAGTLLMAICNASQDTMVSGLMAVACGQLNFLCDKLSGKHKRYDVDSHKNTSNQQTRDHLIDCAKHHNEIIRFIEEIGQLFGTNALTQFGSSCIIVCVTAFKLSIAQLSFEYISMLLYLVCMLMQILNYCYFGNELIITSLRINVAAYESLWYEQSVPNRKLLVLVMERAKRPLQVTAGIFVMSLATFTAILRSSYSFFAVLKQVNNH